MKTCQSPGLGWIKLYNQESQDIEMIVMMVVDGGTTDVLIAEKKIKSWIDGRGKGGKDRLTELERTSDRNSRFA